MKPEGTQELRLNSDSTTKGEPKSKSAAQDAGVRPWHFFVMLSLIAATAAVVVSRQATPEHLIMISLTIGAAGVAAGAFYRMLAPLATRDVSVFGEPLTERARAALEREKTLVLRSLKELEFDRAMGKLSPKDFDEMAGRLRARAYSLMKQLDEGPGYRATIERELRERLNARITGQTSQEGVRLKPDATGRPALRVEGRVEPDATCACGVVNDEDALFCKRCGSSLTRQRPPRDIGDAPPGDRK